jgi:hypothetical protein
MSTTTAGVNLLTLPDVGEKTSKSPDVRTVYIFLQPIQQTERVLQANSL